MGECFENDMDRKEIEKWKVLSSGYLFKEPWFTVRKEEVKLPNGSVIPSYYVLDYPSWICVIAVTRDGEMVMVRQYRHGLGQVSYELCAGVVDSTDSSCMEAAKRELMEETGYGNGDWKQWMIISANPGTHSNLTWCFLATDVEKISSPHLEDTEDLTVELLSIQEIRNLLMQDEMPQAIHAAALWKYIALKK